MRINRDTHRASNVLYENQDACIKIYTRKTIHNERVKLCLINTDLHANHMHRNPDHSYRQKVMQWFLVYMYQMSLTLWAPLLSFIEHTYIRRSITICMNHW